MSCDVNHDNEITIGDINQILNVILSGYSAPSAVRINDVNHDGEISISDINAVINELLKNE